MATAQDVERLFQQQGVPLGYHEGGSNESPQVRAQRIADEINSGQRSWATVTASINRLASRGSAYDFAPIEDRVRQVFNEYGVPLDFHLGGANEDPDARARRIAQEIQSGQRSFDSVVDSVQRLSQVAPPPKAKDTTPTVDFAAEARGMFPWLSGQLLDMYSEFWADTGSPTAALGKLRNTAQYGQVFQGIRREDGTLRMDENQYFSTKAGFREAMSEFGMNPASYEAKFVNLFENEVGADEFHRAMGEAHQRFVEPGATADSGLFSSYIDAFIGSGSALEALESVRGTSAYDEVFQGNRRDDGTIRMDEPEYFAYKRGWQRTLASFSLNPTEFQARGRLGEAVEGELSIEEIGQRLQTVQDGIIDQVDAYREFYAQGYGLELTLEAMLGMAIDPDVQRDVLDRRVTAGQIGGEASLAGFQREIERAEELARAGLDATQARDLYSSASGRLPGLSATSRRFNRGATTLTDYEDVAVFQDSDQMGRIERSLAQEDATFGNRRDVRADQAGALSGLRQR